MSLSSRRLKKQGLEAFDGCKVKTVKVIDYGLPPYIEVVESGGFVSAARREQNSHRKRMEDHPESSYTYWYAGSEAVLECPYTQEAAGIAIKSAHDNHDGADKAYDSLRHNAGLLACRSCQYSGMDPAEVTATRARLAYAEAERIEAEAASIQARAELERITNGIQPPQIRELPSGE